MMQGGIFTFQTFPSLFMAVSGNLTLAWFFVAAFLWPLSRIDLILYMGLWFFAMEFLSIPFAAVSLGRFGRGILYGAVAALQAVAILPPVFFLKDFLLPAMYVVSAASKLFGATAVSAMASRGSRPVGIAMLLLFSTFIVVIVPVSWWQRYLPLPEAVMEEALARPKEGISGLFIEVPQTLLAWGVVYYVLLALLDAWEFFKARSDMREKKARGWESQA